MRTPGRQNRAAAASLAATASSAATAFDPRAVKALVNDGEARYYGVDALVSYSFSTRWSAEGIADTQSHRSPWRTRRLVRIPLRPAPAYLPICFFTWPGGYSGPGRNCGS
jgi:hypothetical protein